MKFAFLIMGNFSMAQDRAEIGTGEAQIWGVANLKEACQAAKTLQSEGVDCIELCGAFGPDGARAVIEATGNQLPVGYITHLPEQDALYSRVFGAH